MLPFISAILFFCLYAYWITTKGFKPWSFRSNRI